MSDLEVKVTVLEKSILKFLVKILEAKQDSGKLLCPGDSSYYTNSKQG